MDTKDCSPSLANFLLGPKRLLLRGSKQGLDMPKPGHAFSRSFGSSNDESHINSTTLGSAVKQLTPINNILSQPKVEKSSVQIKRNLGLNQTKFWESLNISYVFLTGCFIYVSIKLFSMRFSQSRIIPHKWIPNHSKVSSMQNITIDKKLFSPLEKLLLMFRRNFKSGTNGAVNNFSSLNKASEFCGTFVNTRQMKVGEAEALVKQWQQIKAEALGPDHQTENLPEILDGSMLSKWQELSYSAKAKSCFWRFVLLQLSILRADIAFDENGNERAEIEALLEEAAELVDDSQPRKPSYYSKYKVKYTLRRHDDDFSWRICGGGIQDAA